MDDILKPAGSRTLMVAAFENNPDRRGLSCAPMELIDETDQRIFPYFYVFRKNGLLAIGFRWAMGLG